MNETFEVGEIAVIKWVLDPAFAYMIGTEVLVIGPLKWRDYAWPRYDGVLGAECYVIRRADSYECCADPRQLRKRRPPQDWAKICHLDSLPLDVVMDETLELVQS
jgi:hypothetical protein